MAELKETCQKIKDFFRIEKIEDLSPKLSEVVFSSDSFQIYDDYIALVGNLEVDYIQKCYQFFLADRGKNSMQQDYTPPSIAKLVAELADCSSGGTVLDCCAGSGALTIAKHRKDNSLRFVCQELDGNVIPLLLFNLAIRGIEAVVIHGNVLTGECKKIYSLKPMDKYSKVEEISEYTLGQYDTCISNPPYNISWFVPEDDDLRFIEYGIPPKTNANFAFVLNSLHHTKMGGKAVLILPCGIMSTSNSEVAIRANLSKAGYVDSVISLPDKMFESTSISTCILTIRNGVGDKKTTLIDSRRTYHEDVRHQRGEGSRSYTERVYHKIFKILTDEDISTIMQAIKKRDTVPGFCATVSVSDFVAEEYIWAPSRYIELVCEEEKHRPYADIISDLRAIAKEKAAIKITMNETVAKKLGFDKVYEDVAKSQELTKQMNNNVLKLLGLEPIEGNPWLALSKRAGEIKIENTSKNSVSSVIMMFLPMLKQHIYYLNDVENKLLAELRDALLPDFMSGKINVM